MKIFILISLFTIIACSKQEVPFRRLDLIEKPLKKGTAQNSKNNFYLKRISLEYAGLLSMNLNLKMDDKEDRTTINFNCKQKDMYRHLVLTHKLNNFQKENEPHQLDYGLSNSVICNPELVNYKNEMIKVSKYLNNLKKVRGEITIKYKFRLKNKDKLKSISNISFSSSVFNELENKLEMIGTQKVVADDYSNVIVDFNDQGLSYELYEVPVVYKNVQKILKDLNKMPRIILSIENFNYIEDGEVYDFKKSLREVKKQYTQLIINNNKSSREYFIKDKKLLNFLRDEFEDFRFDEIKNRILNLENLTSDRYRTVTIENMNKHQKEMRSWFKVGEITFDHILTGDKRVDLIYSTFEELVNKAPWRKIKHFKIEHFAENFKTTVKPGDKLEITLSKSHKYPQFQKERRHISYYYLQHIPGHPRYNKQEFREVHKTGLFEYLVVKDYSKQVSYKSISEIKRDFNLNFDDFFFAELSNKNSFIEMIVSEDEKQRHNYDIALVLGKKDKVKKTKRIGFQKIIEPSVQSPNYKYYFNSSDKKVSNFHWYNKNFFKGEVNIYRKSI